MKKKNLIAVHNGIIWKTIGTLIVMLLVFFTVTFISFAETPAIEDVVEIVSVEHRKYIENRDGYTKTELDSTGKEVSYIYYNVSEYSLRLALKFKGGETKEYSAYEVMRLYGKNNVEIAHDQSADHPWHVGAHKCTVRIGTMEKEFTVMVEPNPIDHISVVQKCPAIKDVHSGRVSDLLSVNASMKDGSVKKIEGYFLSVEPYDCSELSVGKNTVSVSIWGISTEAEIEVIENPYESIKVDEKEPLQVTLIQNDGKTKTAHISDGSQRYDNENLYSVETDLGSFELVYDKEKKHYSIGKMESNSTPSLQWLEQLGAMSRESGYSRYYATEYDNGTFTEDNIDNLISLAMLSPRDGYQDTPNTDLTLKGVSERMKAIFGVDSIDYTVSTLFDPATETFTVRRPTTKIDGGPLKVIVTYENGQYVQRQYLGDDEVLAFENDPILIVTYDTDLHITGIYLHDIDTSDRLPGDINGDGKVGSDDARLALRASVGLESYAQGSVEFAAADANHDGKIGSDDARLILRASVGLEQLTPAPAAA